MDQKFTVDRTMICKGVALLLLLWHHISRVYFKNDGWITNLGILAKVCVCMFLILSGYGLSASYAKKNHASPIRFVLNHLYKIMSKFWLIYIVFLPINIFYAHRSLSEVYGYMRWDNMLIDFLGLNHIFKTPSLTGVWWYMGAMIVLYILFPYLYYIMENNIVIFSVGNIVIAILVGLAWHSIIQTQNPIPFYLFAFSVGMFLQKTNLLNYILNLLQRSKIYCLIGVTVLIICAILRWHIGNEIDTLFGVSIIIIFSALIPKQGIIHRVLYILGQYSGEMYMLHGFVYARCFTSWVYICDNIFVVLFLTAIYSLLFSIGINKLYEIIRKLNPAKHLLRS